MIKTPETQNVRPKDLEWLAQSLRLAQAFSEEPALETLLKSLPNIALEAWPAQQDVLREGEHGDDFFVVYAGELSVWHCAGKAPAREAGRLRPGDFFGEVGFLMRSARSATVRTESACRVFRFPAHEFADLLKRHIALDVWVKTVAFIRIRDMFIGDGR
jgi:CRP-like cAMP-binding protein